MDPGTLASTTSTGLLFSTAVVAALLGTRLLWAGGIRQARGWLGIRLVGSALLIASFAALSFGVNEPRGNTAELFAFAVAAAGASHHLLDIPVVLSETRDQRERPLPAWGLAFPLAVPLGLLVYAWDRWPASTLPVGETFATWDGFTGYDAVEDATGSLALGCLALAVVGATLLLLARSYSTSPASRRTARRMLMQGWGPVLVWTAAIGLVFLSAALQPAPADPVTVFAQRTLLRSQVPFSLIVLGPVLWGLDRVSLTGEDQTEGSPVGSNRS